MPKVKTTPILAPETPVILAPETPEGEGEGTEGTEGTEGAIIAPETPETPETPEGEGEGEGDQELDDVLTELGEGAGNNPNAASEDGTIRLWDGKPLPPTEWANYLALSRERSKISKIAPENRTDDQRATVKAFSKAYNAYDKALTKARSAGLLPPAKTRPNAQGSKGANSPRLAENRALASRLSRYDQTLTIAQLRDKLSTDNSPAIPVTSMYNGLTLNGVIWPYVAPVKAAKTVDPVKTVQAMSTNDIASALTPEKRAELLAILMGEDASALAAK